MLTVHKLTAQKQQVIHECNSGHCQWWHAFCSSEQVSSQDSSIISATDSQAKYKDQYQQVRQKEYTTYLHQGSTVTIQGTLSIRPSGRVAERMGWKTHSKMSHPSSSTTLRTTLYSCQGEYLVTSAQTCNCSLVLLQRDLCGNNIQWWQYKLVRGLCPTRHSAGCGNSFCWTLCQQDQWLTSVLSAITMLGLSSKAATYQKRKQGCDIVPCAWWLIIHSILTHQTLTSYEEHLFSATAEHFFLQRSLQDDNHVVQRVSKWSTSIHTFTFAQQVHIPLDPLQPGPVYF